FRWGGMRLLARQLGEHAGALLLVERVPLVPGRGDGPATAGRVGGHASIVWAAARPVKPAQAQVRSGSGVGAVTVCVFASSSSSFFIRSRSSRVWATNGLVAPTRSAVASVFS